METMVDSSVGRMYSEEYLEFSIGVCRQRVFGDFTLLKPLLRIWVSSQTNITNFLIGKRLTSNIVTSSLKLDWSSDIMRIVDPQADQTGIAEIDNNPIPEDYSHYMREGK